MVVEVPGVEVRQEGGHRHRTEQRTRRRPPTARHPQPARHDGAGRGVAVSRVASSPWPPRHTRTWARTDARVVAAGHVTSAPGPPARADRQPRPDGDGERAEGRDPDEERPDEVALGAQQGLGVAHRAQCGGRRDGFDRQGAPLAEHRRAGGAFEDERGDVGRRDDPALTRLARAQHARADRRPVEHDRARRFGAFVVGEAGDEDGRVDGCRVEHLTQLRVAAPLERDVRDGARGEVSAGDSRPVVRDDALTVRRTERRPFSDGADALAVLLQCRGDEPHA